MISINTNNAIPSDNNFNSKTNNIKSKNDKSVFEKLDTDGIVNEEDFSNNVEIGEKIKSLGYFGTKWDAVRTIISGLFENKNKDGFINILTDEYQNMENQILIKDIDVTKSWNDVEMQMKLKGILPNEDGSYSFKTNENLEIKIVKDGERICTKIKNIDGQLLQTIDGGDCTRANGIFIQNYNNNGQKISSLMYTQNNVLNIVETYNYDSNGTEKDGTRYLAPRHGVKADLAEKKKVTQGVINITPEEHKPISGTYKKYDLKGKITK